MSRTLPAGRANRVIMVCTALNKDDTPMWPFWKWQQIKATRGVTDFVMLAVTRDESFIGRIDGSESYVKPLRKGLQNIDRKLLHGFLDEWHLPGKSYFVYGGHGVSDHLEFERSHVLQMYELADIFGPKVFEAILFDACLMSSLDTAYFLRHNTRFIGAAEGYMWEEDTWHANHIFNGFAATAMSRHRDPLKVLNLIGDEYTRKSAMADFSVIDTTHAQQLWRHVQAHHMDRIQSSVTVKPDVASGKAPLHRCEPPPEGFVLNGDGATAADVPRTPEFRQNFDFENVLYPAEADDGHIVDLYSFLDGDAEAQDLFKKVVVSHVGPAKTSLYATPVHGLNVALGRYNHVSKPITAVAAGKLTDIIGDKVLKASQALRAADGPPSAPRAKTPPKRSPRAAERVRSAGERPVAAPAVLRDGPAAASAPTLLADPAPEVLVQMPTVAASAHRTPTMSAESGVAARAVTPTAAAPAPSAGGAEQEVAGGSE
jgi:hypothetical protein